MDNEFLNGLLTVYAYEYIDEEQVLEITRSNYIDDEVVLDFVHYLEWDDFHRFDELIKQAGRSHEHN